MVKKPIERLRVQSTSKSRPWLKAAQKTEKSKVQVSGIQGRTVIQEPEIPIPDDELGSDASQKFCFLKKSERSRPVKRSSAPRRITTRLSRRAKPFIIPVVWISLLAFCGGTGVAAFLGLISMPPSPNCKKLSFWTSETTRLLCVEQSVRVGDEKTLLAGLNQIKTWTNHPLPERIAQLRRDWSQAAFTIAQTKANQNNLKGAIAIAKKIPTNSPNYKQIQAMAVKWQKDLTRQQAIDKRIETALKAQNWAAAEDQLIALGRQEIPYWKEHIYQLRQSVIIERMDHERFQQAHELAQEAVEYPEQLSQAIDLIEEINSGSYVYPQARTELTKLSQSLQTLLTAKLTQADWTGASEIVQQFPKSLPLPIEAQHFVWFNQAQLLTTQNTPKVPIAKQLWQFWLATDQLHRIASTSPLSAQARILTPQLEQQIQDLTQLHFASIVANLPSVPTLNSAVQMAQTITLDRPQRLLAQTLIAQWHKERQRVEDQPYLAAAKRQAQMGGIKWLKVAIAQASQIAPGRALRPEAQAAIYEWQQEIQKQEEQEAERERG